MLVYKNGDILKATENIICHQVNVAGVMGGGLALQIAKSYPKVEKIYKKCCEEYRNDYQLLNGMCLMLKINSEKYIANCFTQKTNFDTDYEALKICFEDLLESCKDYNKTIAVPYGYGCGIANGDWDYVSYIFETLSNQYDVPISIYKLSTDKEIIGVADGTK